MPAAPLTWSGLTLAEGHAGVALLFAELSHDAPEHRAAAHAHLAAASSGLSKPHIASLYHGAPSLAFAARMSQHSPNDYSKLLDRLDEQVTRQVQYLLTEEDERLDAGRAGVRPSSFDVIAGASGLGRYQLLCEPPQREILSRILSYMVRLAQPVSARGHTVPGWWVPTQPTVGSDNPRFARGHFNTGIAHGICGPLILLSLGWEAGVKVPGHAEAISSIVNHLLAYRHDDGHWPSIIGFDEFVEAIRMQRPDDNTITWCYGTAGVARALYLAGRALGRNDWRQTAIQALCEALDKVLLRQPPEVTDCTLCHGWAGLLQITSRMAHDSDDARLFKLLPRLTEPIFAAYDQDLSFGFRYERPNMAPHRAGFLQGAAGIALALHAHATGRPPARDWDAALLLN
ncbi:lanthionine synthetase C family protein [Streptomyces lydicus]